MVLHSLALPSSLTSSTPLPSLSDVVKLSVLLSTSIPGFFPPPYLCVTWAFSSVSATHAESDITDYCIQEYSLPLAMLGMDPGLTHARLLPYL